MNTPLKINKNSPYFLPIIKSSYLSSESRSVMNIYLNKKFCQKGCLSYEKTVEKNWCLRNFKTVVEGFGISGQYVKDTRNEKSNLSVKR